MTVRAFAGERIYYYNCHRNGGNDFAWYSNNLPGGITSEIITSDSNPFLDHLWLSISVQFSSKMKMRNVPILLQHYAKTSQVPETMALAFAAFILFMKTKQTGENKYEGHANGKSYIVQDDNVALFAEHWQNKTTDEVVDIILADTNFWGCRSICLTWFYRSC